MIACDTVQVEEQPIVARLRRAGFILIGRTNMTEFAYSGMGINPHYGTPRNPWERAQARLTNSAALAIRLEYPEPPGMKNMHAFGQTGVDLYVDGIYRGTAIADRDAKPGKTQEHTYFKSQPRSDRAACTRLGPGSMICLRSSLPMATRSPHRTVRNLRHMQQTKNICARRGPRIETKQPVTRNRPRSWEQKQRRHKALLISIDAHSREGVERLLEKLMP